MRTREPCHSIKLFLTQRREEQVVSGDPLRLYRLDRMRRIDHYGGEEHREGRFRNRLTLRVTLTSVPRSGFVTTRICGPLKTRFIGG